MGFAVPAAQHHRVFQDIREAPAHGRRRWSTPATTAALSSAAATSSGSSAAAAARTTFAALSFPRCARH
eukprot:4277858-Pyramimonas_sp.AAC.1